MTAKAEWLSEPLCVSMYAGVFVYFAFENFNSPDAYAIGIVAWCIMVFGVAMFYQRIATPKFHKWLREQDLEDMYRIRYGRPPKRVTHDLVEETQTRE